MIKEGFRESTGFETQGISQPSLCNAQFDRCRAGRATGAHNATGPYPQQPYMTPVAWPGSAPVAREGRPAKATNDAGKISGHPMQEPRIGESRSAELAACFVKAEPID